MTPKRTKTVKVKGVAILALYPDPDEPFIEYVYTYGEYGRYGKLSHARSCARVKKIEDDRLIDCVVTFTIPQKGKKK